MENKEDKAFSGRGRPKKEDQSELATLRQENEILKKAAAYFAKDLKVKYAFIQDYSKQYKITRLCHALEVSPGGYYDWRDRPESSRAKRNRQLVTKIKLYHKASHRIYRSPRIHQDLLDAGELVGENRVARLMNRHGIQSKVSKKFIITTDSKNTMQPAKDRLKQQIDIEKPDKAWVSDTTFIPTRQGWLYLAVVIDLYSRQVLG